MEEGLPPAKPLPLTYEFNLPEDGDATIQLFTSSGELARTLVGSGGRRAGRNVERWDGLDATGQPLAAGKYVVKGLYHQPITTKYLFSAHNSGQPPYHTDDRTGGWGGDHGNPSTACAVGDGMVLGWSISEAGYGTIRTDLHGKKLWSSIHNAIDIATDGQRYFVERLIEDAKGPLGFDEFCAQKYRAVEHHLALTALALWFVAQTKWDWAQLQRRDPALAREMEVEWLPALSTANVRELLQAVLPLPELTVEQAMERVVEHLVNRARSTRSRLRKQQAGADSP